MYGPKECKRSSPCGATAKACASVLEEAVLSCAQVTLTGRCLAVQYTCQVVLVRQ